MYLNSFYVSIFCKVDQIDLLLGIIYLCLVASYVLSYYEPKTYSTIQWDSINELKQKHFFPPQRWTLKHGGGGGSIHDSQLGAEDKLSCSLLGVVCTAVTHWQCQPLSPTFRVLWEPPEHPVRCRNFDPVQSEPSSWPSLSCHAPSSHQSDNWTGNSINRQYWGLRRV